MNDKQRKLENRLVSLIHAEKENWFHGSKQQEKEYDLHLKSISRSEWKNKIPEKPKKLFWNFFIFAIDNQSIGRYNKSRRKQFLFSQTSSEKEKTNEKNSVWSQSVWNWRN
jgi:hypothetical protein